MQITDQPITEYILSVIKKLERETGIRRTLLAACPNSKAVIKAALRSAKRCNAPVIFAATLNQVDLDGGYTGMTQKGFVSTILTEACAIDFTGPVIIAVDHGGPWLKDLHRTEKWSYTESMATVKKSFEAAVDAGYHLIHVDPTVDITIPEGEVISIELVAERTAELMAHVENYRRKKGLPRISYEVGTEEVHGGLADMSVFNRFFVVLEEKLGMAGIGDTWPCFVVGKVGTDLHTSLFDKEVAGKLVNIAADHGCYVKGHYTDNVDNPEDYPMAGMGAANVGPEFTEREYEGLLALDLMEDDLYKEGKVSERSLIMKNLWLAVLASGRWEKWLQPNEHPDDFKSLDADRQEWLVKTGCRYIWENPEVFASRSLLYKNLTKNGIDAEKIVLSHIEKAMEKYFFRFNLYDLNKYL